MDALQNMMTRKSVKKYKADPVPKELLDKIMARSSGIAEEMTTGPIDDDDDVMSESEE